jgi:hypothetical protein
MILTLFWEGGRFWKAQRGFLHSLPALHGAIVGPVEGFVHPFGNGTSQTRIEWIVVHSFAIHHAS